MTMEHKKVIKTHVGKVVSDQMQKTVVVSVERTYLHPSLGKVIRTNKHYKVHDEYQLAHTGDIVKIYEGRPQSKTKYMYLDQIVSRAADQAS